MATVTSKDGTRIAFDVRGKGLAVVLVDGAMSYRQNHGGEALANALSKDFRVYTYDRRGRGESTDTQPYAVEREIEDIRALFDHAGGIAFLYGASSGAALALKAARALGGKRVIKLALYEPPFDPDEDAKRTFADYKEQTHRLIQENKHSEAVTLFLKDMLPPDVLETMRQTPEWALMEAVAPTLNYDNTVLGDGSVPVIEAQALTMPTLLLSGTSSEGFFTRTVEMLMQAIRYAQRKTLEDQTHMADPAVLAPVLTEFFLSSSLTLPESHG